jgi:hypothetical protein
VRNLLLLWGFAGGREGAWVEVRVENKGLGLGYCGC